MRKWVWVLSTVCVVVMVATVLGVFFGSLKAEKAQPLTAMVALFVTVLYVVLTGETLQVLKQQVESRKLPSADSD